MKLLRVWAAANAIYYYHLLINLFTYGDLMNAFSFMASKTSRKRIFEVSVWP